MNFNYHIYNPTGNITALVETPVKKEWQPFVASKIMEKERSVEQVGFITKDGLRMAGGEFCGNASLCFGVFLSETKAQNKTETKWNFSVSGADFPVETEYKKLKNGTYQGKVNMPYPLGITKEKLTFEGNTSTYFTVNFEGISHIILEDTPDKCWAEKAVADFCRQLNAAALGIMFLNKGSMELTPLVYVPDAKTCIWESSCASGTAAVGYYLFKTDVTETTTTLKEPGGILTVEADSEKILIGGNIDHLSTKEIDIDL